MKLFKKFILLNYIFLKGFCLYLIGYVLVNLIANTDTNIFICGNSSLNIHTNVTSFTNERCFGAIIGTLILT
jgi:hypothetical protein